uniref:LIM zinc-binding domain-containing protein n=1 Tax=Heterorhabditis bacteriophora TaxID=37862 RepID=A0A1I7XF63_HETBA
MHGLGEGGSEDAQALVTQQDVSISGTESCVLCVCARCEMPIRERYVNRVMERSFHTECLRCCVCNEQLSSTCFMKEDCLYCKQHFYKLLMFYTLLFLFFFI